MENTVQTTKNQRKLLRFTPSHFKLLIFSLLAIFVSSFAFAAEDENVNAKLVLINGINCNPNEMIYFKVVPTQSYPDGVITGLEITSIDPNGLGSMVQGDNPDEFGIASQGLADYKVSGTFKIEFPDRESIEVAFQSVLRLKNYIISFNNQTTTYNNANEIRTISITNPIPGLV